MVSITYTTGATSAYFRSDIWNGLFHLQTHSHLSPEVHSWPCQTHSQTFLNTRGNLSLNLESYPQKRTRATQSHPASTLVRFYFWKLVFKKAELVKFPALGKSLSSFQKSRISILPWSGSPGWIPLRHTCGFLLPSGARRKAHPGWSCP